jgi:adenosylhomocysteinase
VAGKAACVLGYGKIGSSIATNLRQRGALVTVIDIDPARQALALAHGYNFPKRTDHLREYHLIFGATGRRSLRRSDFHRLRDGCYIFTATSGDDEIEDYSAVLNDCAITRHPKIVAFGRRHKVLICNNGNSANFMHGGVVGPFIKLVQAELVLAAVSIEQFGRDQIFELDAGVRRLIAQRWMEAYAHQ